MSSDLPECFQNLSAKSHRTSGNIVQNFVNTILFRKCNSFHRRRHSRIESKNVHATEALLDIGNLRPIDILPKLMTERIETKVTQMIRWRRSFPGAED
jgi:hypothetical protein